MCCCRGRRFDLGIFTEGAGRDHRQAHLDPVKVSAVGERGWERRFFQETQHLLVANLRPWRQRSLCC
ncbi:hypothetical protein GQ55_9G328100 [Panicum hallii var. hallii]|uniref:Uncharacterized protein n=1 Tax=Panicum hallii var. hallii TaxID=1504633 RepID=A0A2T7C8G8_9POAL|nr:hypothetical protein GQ55_9G328100 [Panicum hallii var. hallii]